MSDADADTDADIQLLRRPETLTLLCDIVTYPDHGRWGAYGLGYKRIAEAAATKGRGVSPELWAAGIWAITRFGSASGPLNSLAILVSEVRASVCSDYHCPIECQVESPTVEMLKIAYMICPKDSPVLPFILYSLARRVRFAPVIIIRASPGAGTESVTYEGLLAAALNHPMSTARLRVIVLCDQARVLRRCPANATLVHQAYEIDPTFSVVYTCLISYCMDADPACVIRLGTRMVNRWGLSLEAIATIVGESDVLYYSLRQDGIPQLDGTVISLGDSSISVFDYICALETPYGSFFRPEMLTDMLPADTPWTCRRHEALDRRTGANALFATFLCALARLEGPGGPLRPSHQTMWEDALESWALGDSAGMYNAPR